MASTTDESPDDAATRELICACAFDAAKAASDGDYQAAIRGLQEAMKHAVEATYRPLERLRKAG